MAAIKKSYFLVLGVLALACASAVAQTENRPGTAWIASWSSAQQAVCDAALLPAQGWRGGQLQETVRVSVGGARVRLRLSNAFGDGPLAIASVQVAELKPRAQSKNAQPDQLQHGEMQPVQVRFQGAIEVVIPPGAEYESDPIDLAVKPLASLRVQLRLKSVPRCATSHTGARATTVLTRADGSEESFQHWYFLSAVAVEPKEKSSGVVVLGDSITDGRGATNDGNNRWTDVLAEHLKVRGIAVLNEGIGGNRILAEGLGPSALSRFNRDVLSLAGARVLLVQVGINDIGSLELTSGKPEAEHTLLVQQLEQALAQMTTQAHAHGMRVVCATLTPFLGSAYYHPSLLAEQDRQQLNEWIRGQNISDRVVDFDLLLRDREHPGQLATEFDSGDRLHPNPAGYKRMGEGAAAVLSMKQ